MRWFTERSIQERIIGGFLLCAFLTALSAGMAIVALHLIQGNLTSTTTEIQETITRETAQGEHLARLREMVFAISTASDLDKLYRMEHRLESLQAGAGDEDAFTRAALERVEAFLAAKTMLQESEHQVRLLGRLYDRTLERLSRTTTELADEMHFATMLPYETGRATEELPARLVRRRLEHIHDILLVRSYTHELDAFVKELLMDEDAAVIAYSRLVVQALVMNMRHHLEALPRNPGVADILASVAELAELIEWLLESRVAILNAEQTLTSLLTSSEDETELEPARASLPEIMDRLHQKTFAATSQLESTAQRNLDATSSLVLRWEAGLVMVGLAALFLAMAVAYFVPRSVIAPIRRAAQLADDIRRGDLSVRLNLPTHDELGQLSQALDSMAGSLEEQIRERENAENELAVLNRNLERLVRERTRDLAQKAKELEAANRELTKMDELKTAFLSSVSHELRTPLTSILGFAKLVKKSFDRNFKGLAGEEQALQDRARAISQNLEVIELEGGRLTRLINDILDVAKIESGRITWNDADVQPVEMIVKSAHALEGLFAQLPDVELRTEVPEELPLLHVDRDRLEQVLLNLLSNAAKFTRQGHVTIRGLATDDGFVQIDVEDTGTGIPVADRARIFDKFHQAVRDDTSEEKPTGTGLGLAICKQIVEHYDGRIWVESQPGQGSTFSVALPYGEMAERSRHQQVRTYTPLPGDRSQIPVILVIEDDDSTRSYLDQLFSQAGYCVITAPDGRSGLQTALEHSPDLITVDLLMPVMDGRTTISALRRDPQLGTIPLVVVSVLSERDTAGGDAAIAKPVDENLLLATVNCLLSRDTDSCPRLLVLGGAETLASGGAWFSTNYPVHESCDAVELARFVAEGFQGTVIVPHDFMDAQLTETLLCTDGVQLVVMPPPDTIPAEARRDTRENGGDPA
jgi:signal transduction histidine kinase/CheY-like chemotaxis protein